MMAYTLRDIIDKLKQFDEITLLELLDISSEELLERFIDKVENNFEQLEDLIND
jgi:hypothetical protein